MCVSHPLGIESGPQAVGAFIAPNVEGLTSLAMLSNHFFPWQLLHSDRGFLSLFGRVQERKS